MAHPSSNFQKNVIFERKFFLVGHLYHLVENPWYGTFHPAIRLNQTWLSHFLSIVPLHMSHVSPSMSQGYSLGYPQDLSNFKNFIFGSGHDTVFEIIYFCIDRNACSIPFLSQQLLGFDCCLVKRLVAEFCST